METIVAVAGLALPILGALVLLIWRAGRFTARIEVQFQGLRADLNRLTAVLTGLVDDQYELKESVGTLVVRVDNLEEEVHGLPCNRPGIEFCPED